MVKLTFKEVGQGDSIIVEWANEEEKYIGFIDCNLKPGNINPSLNYLESTDYSAIKFIILSHPHDDHFSGINQLLSYCETNGIVIHNFYHSCLSVPEYLKSAVFSFVAKRELGILFQNVSRLKKIGIIAKAPLVTDTTKHIDLADGFKLDFLSPSDIEYEAYNRVMYKERTGLKNNNPDANVLSTVISIFNENYSLLLTSDAIRSVLKRLGQKETERLGNNLSLAQMPHHGAKANFYREFWKKRKFPIGMPAVISVGENIYEHPSLEAIQSLQEIGATIHSTNSIYHCREPNIAEVTEYLDWFTKTTTPVQNFMAVSQSKDIVCHLHSTSIDI